LATVLNSSTLRAFAEFHAPEQPSSIFEFQLKFSLVFGDAISGYHFLASESPGHSIIEQQS
jgi:hypothetical protein